MKNAQIKLVFSAMLLSLAHVLSFLKLIQMPLGGSVTFFSMLVISLPAYLFGTKYGFLASFTYSLLQFIVGSSIIHPLQVFFDYIFAYSCFGVVGFFRNMKNGLTIGFIVACIIRFLSSSISGYIFYRQYTPEAWNELMYIVVYNGGYIFTECVFSIAFMNIPVVSNLIWKLREKVSE